jgi:hypothetical protein
LQIIDVENILARVLCPLQIGYMKANDLQVSLKCCIGEGEGQVCMLNERLDIVSSRERGDTLASFERSHILKSSLGNIQNMVYETKSLLKVV